MNDAYAPTVYINAEWLQPHAKHENSDVVWRDEPPDFVPEMVAALKPGQRVLEMCARDGRFTKALLRSGASVIPTDISLHALEQLQVNFKSNGLEVPLLVIASPKNLPFPSESFDAAVCVDCICQIDDLRSALEEVHRVLKPGGLFIANVFTPHDAAWGQGEQVGALSWAYKGTRFHFFVGDLFRSFCSPLFTVEKVRESRWDDPPHGDFRPQPHTHVANLFILRKSE